MMKVKVKTNAYRNRILIGFARIFIAMVAIGFFLYFFSYEVIELKKLENVKAKIALNEKFEQKFDLINEDRSAALHWIIDPADVGSKKKYEDLKEEVEAMLDEVYSWTSNYPRAHTLDLKELIKEYDDLSDRVLTGDFSKVEFYSFYVDLLQSLGIFWTENCETDNYKSNAYITTDYYWNSYVSFFTIRRDIMIGITHLNLTSEEIDELSVIYYKAKAFENYFYQFTIRFYSEKQLEAWEKLFAEEQNGSYVDLLENITLSFEANSVLEQEIDEFEELIDQILDLFEEIDELETFDPNEGIYERFSISLVGVLFEFVTAISLIWMAIPITKLLIAFHSTTPSQRKEGTELSHTQTSTH